MPDVQHSASIEVTSSAEAVAAVLVAHIGAQARSAEVFEAPIPDDPTDDGSLVVTLTPTGPSSSTVEITASSALRLPYFHGIVAMMVSSHYERTTAWVCGVIEHELGDGPRVDRPKPSTLLPPVPFTSEQAVLLATAGFALAVATFGQSIIGQFAKSVSTSYSLSDHGISNVLSVLRIGALVALFATTLADRFGRRKVTLWSLYGLAAANLASALAPDPTSFTVLQTIARGFSTAVLIVAAVAALEGAPERARGYATSMLALAGGAGFAVTVITFSFLGRVGWGWRAMFVLSAVSGLFVSRIASHLKESHRYERLVDADVARGRVRAVFGRAYRRRFILLALIAFLTNILAAPSATLTNKYLSDARHYSDATILLLRATTTTFPGLLGLVLAARFVEQYGRRSTAVVCLSFGAIARAVFFLCGGPLLWICSALGDLLIACGSLAIGTQNIELFPTETRGTSNGLVVVVGVMGSILGLQTVGVLSDPLGGLGPPLAICAAGTLLAAIAVVPFLPETNRLDLDDISPSSPTT